MRTDLWPDGQVRAAVRKLGCADECDGRCDAVHDHNDDPPGPGGPADAAGGRRGRHRAQPELALRPIEHHRRRHCLARPGRALTAAGQTKRNMNYWSSAPVLRLLRPFLNVNITL